MTTQTVLQGDEALAYVKGLEARQDFITVLGAKQGLWNQAIQMGAIGSNMARAWEISASTVVSTPIYQDLGNGWTSALIPVTDAYVSNGSAYGTTSFILDSISGYQYNRSSTRMDFYESINLQTAYNCNSSGYYAVYTPVEGVMNSDYTVYVTYLGTGSTYDGSTMHETGYFYIKYPSNMTGLTLAIPNKSYTFNPDMQINETGGSNYAANSAFMNKCTFFKIN